MTDRESDVVVLLPVYNGSRAYLEIALQSALPSLTGFPLWIYDDASPAPWVEPFLRGFAAQHARVHYFRQPRNLGLFGNLNSAIRSVPTNWFLILCSDDELLPDAAVTARQHIAAYPLCDLIVSEFVAIDATGTVRPSSHGEHLREIRQTSGVVPRQRAIESALRLGSFNGNITGMLISAEGARRLPPFREDWRQAADWLWLADVSRFGTLAITFQSLARVRLHDQKLSASNFHSGIAVSEELAVVRMLAALPELQSPRAKEWTSAIGAEFLWRSLRLGSAGYPRAAWGGLQDVYQTAGLVGPAKQVIRSLPSRLRRRLDPSAQNRSRPIQE